MTDQPNNYKGVIWALLLLTLLLPVIQSQLGLFTVKELDGAFTSPPRVYFKTNYWLDGSYQKAADKWYDVNFGFRNTLVRLNNQIRYSLFKKTSNRDAFFGKEGYLFAGDYILSYTGGNTISKDTIEKKSSLLKSIQDSLNKRGILLLTIIAPNKARALNQYLPSGYNKQPGNYDSYIEAFNRHHIQFIDFNKYFADQVAQSPFPLFSKYGVHWSSYGHFLAADSLLCYLNKMHGLNLPEMKWKDNIVLSDTLRDLDYDMAASLNLFVNQLPSSKMAYPRASFSEAGSKPSVMVIGDSYNEGLEKTGIYSKVFTDYKFLSYFKVLFPYRGDPEGFYNLNLRQEILSSKVILIEATEHNLVNLGYGFLEYLNAVFNNAESKTQYYLEKRTKYYEKAIRSDKNWFQLIEKRSVSENLNIDSLLTENAKFMVIKEQKENKKGD